MNEFNNILGIKPVAQKVLSSIVRHGISSVADLSSRLNIPKSSIYDALSSLVAASLVNEYSDDKGKTFGISDTEQLNRVHKEKLKDFQDAHTSLLSFISSAQKDDSVAKPKIKFYSGTLGIKQAFRDMMWKKDIKETFLFWPAKDMISIDEDFFKWHGTQRFKYKVFIYAIERHEDRAIQRNKKHEWLHNTKESLSSARYLSKGVNSQMSFWIYGNKCLFASGGKEKIAFTVHSKEFCQMMMIMWKDLWKNAKE